MASAQPSTCRTHQTSQTPKRSHRPFMSEGYLPGHQCHLPRRRRRHQKGGRRRRLLLHPRQLPRNDRRAHPLRGRLSLQLPRLGTRTRAGHLDRGILLRGGGGMPQGGRIRCQVPLLARRIGHRGVRDARRQDRPRCGEAQVDGNPRGQGGQEEREATRQAQLRRRAQPEEPAVDGQRGRGLEGPGHPIRGVSLPPRGTRGLPRPRVRRRRPREEAGGVPRRVPRIPGGAPHLRPPRGPVGHVPPQDGTRGRRLPHPVSPVARQDRRAVRGREHQQRRGGHAVRPRRHLPPDETAGAGGLLVHGEHRERERHGEGEGAVLGVEEDAQDQQGRGRRERAGPVRAGHSRCRRHPRRLQGAEADLRRVRRDHPTSREGAVLPPVRPVRAALAHDVRRQPLQGLRQASQGERLPEPPLLESQAVEGDRVAVRGADSQQRDASRGRVRRRGALVVQAQRPRRRAAHRDSPRSNVRGVPQVGPSVAHEAGDSTAESRRGARA
mmetsp:Transcript_16992/g.36860  ORF Transcript_16992/g.36860 Transcript_16992/m.36860 type:complete len:496 (+) Transcript_16992:1066-2553(+)